MKNVVVRKMKDDENKINLSSFIFRMSLFLSCATLSKPTLLALCWSSSRIKAKP